MRRSALLLNRPLRSKQNTMKRRNSICVKQILWYTSVAAESRWHVPIIRVEICPTAAHFGSASPKYWRRLNND